MTVSQFFIIPLLEFQSQLHPILIVPQQLIKGSLCTGNVQQFLEKGNYVEDSTDREQPVQIKRVINKREVIFDVYDNTTGFSETKWRRVVGVFCNGNDWQFKDWKPTRGPGTEISKKELFARVRGYFMTFGDVKIPSHIDSWNVLKLQLPRNKRHHDVNEQTKFWNDFETFLKRERFSGSVW